MTAIASAAGTSERPQPISLGLLAFLASTVMLFTTFIAAYMVRRTGSDWQAAGVPWLAWLNLIALAAASVTMERARGASDLAARRTLLRATFGLGVLFLVGQLGVWGLMASAGHTLRAHPQAAFVYMLTGVHGVHLLGGLVALLRAERRPEWLGGCAFYWHSIGVLWVLVLMVLSVA